MKNGDRYFAPGKIVAGFFPYNGRKDFLRENKYLTGPIGGTAIVTCRYRNRNWLQSAAFERLTDGFRPTSMRDSEKQLRKEVTSVVAEYANEPTSGFKVIRDAENLYGRQTVEYDYVGDVVIQDPRGFAFGVSHQSFFDTLSSNGGNMTDGSLDGEFVYAWSDDERRHELTLVPVSDPDYAKIMAASEAADVKPGRAVATVAKSELVPGKLYKACSVLDGWYMYVGEYDTYSGACHLDAIENGRYAEKSFALSEKGAVYGRWDYRFPTGKDKLVFYAWKNGTQDPFVVRTSVSGIFSETRDPSASDGITMFDDPATPATLGSIRASMSKSLGFARLDLSKTGSFRPMGFGLFEAMFQDALRTSATFGSPKLPQSSPCETPFPFRCWPMAKVLRCGEKWVQARTSGACMRKADWSFIDLGKTPYVRNGGYYNFSHLDVSRLAFARGSMTVKDAYAALSPKIPDLWLENGTAAPDGACACLLPKKITEAAWI